MSGPLLDEGLDLFADSVQSVWSTIASTHARGGGAQRILFTSPDHGSGTTTLAACTAIALCRNLAVGVALVEANVFTPALAAYLGCSATPGLAEVLRGEVPTKRGFQDTSVPGLRVMPAGAQSPDAPTEWTGAAARSLFAETIRAYPLSIIDAPPLLARPSARLLLGYCDSVVLVLRAGVASKPDARMTIQILQETGVRVSGLILNRYQSVIPFARRRTSRAGRGASS
jgi:Mrp family chromosome partitioning ATPase